MGKEEGRKSRKGSRWEGDDVRMGESEKMVNEEGFKGRKQGEGRGKE